MHQSTYVSEINISVTVQATKNKFSLELLWVKQHQKWKELFASENVLKKGEKKASLAHEYVYIERAMSGNIVNVISFQ